MVIGNGDIASILNDRPNVLFFASGVSNSSCTDEAQFRREKELLLAQDKGKCVFYFSSIMEEGLYKSPYYSHKRRMELLIKSNFNNYNILRLGNITWGKNPNTFLNFIRDKRDKGQEVEIRDEFKYMIDKDDLLFLTDHLPLRGQNVISVFSRMAKVADLI